MQTEKRVYIVDDDSRHCQIVRQILHTVQLDVSEFYSAEAFLDVYQPTHPGCIVVDIRMPGIGGLELCQKLRGQGMEIPIIMVTGYADVPLAVRAMKGGAFDFFEKPLNEQAFIDSVKQALNHDQKQRERQRLRGYDQRREQRDDYMRERYAERQRLLERMQTLTPREKEVMQLLVLGKSNKSIAAQLNVGYKTVEAHRGKVVEKMQAQNLAELVRMGVLCGL